MGLLDGIVLENLPSVVHDFHHVTAHRSAARQHTHLLKKIHFTIIPTMTCRTHLHHGRYYKFSTIANNGTMLGLSPTGGPGGASGQKVTGKATD
jgi:hypothetical protein